MVRVSQIYNSLEFMNSILKMHDTCHRERYSLRIVNQQYIIPSVIDLKLCASASKVSWFREIHLKLPTFQS